MSFDGQTRRVPRGVLSRTPETLERLERAAACEPNRESGQRPLPSSGSLAQSSMRKREAQRAPTPARVLLVEPVAVLRTIMTRAFADRGHSVTAVASLDEMRRLLPSFDPHVVVCELALPDGSGDVACRRLKASASKLRPVVLISGVPEGELMRRSRDAGADRFHCKSRGLSELIELVEELSDEIVF